MKMIRILLIAVVTTAILAAVLFWRDCSGGGFVCLALMLVLSIILWTMLANTADTLRFLTQQARSQLPVDSGANAPAEIKTRDLQLFINQINPHFLYNTLDGIRGQALENDQWEIALMTEKLSRFFRYCISSRGDIVRLAEELRNVQDYFGIQKFRFGDRIELHIDIEDDAVLQYYVPKLTMQPIIENAIVHGIEGHTGNGHVWLNIRTTKNTLYINVTDDGGGMSLEQLTLLRRKLDSNEISHTRDGKHTGIAVHNVHSRIRLCFGPDYGLIYRSTKGMGTNVEISMPIVDDYSRAALESKLRNVW